MSEKKILITGAHGRLGTALQKLIPADPIDRDELDITNNAAVKLFFESHEYDTLIHCAAFTDVAGAENKKKECYTINVVGTENLVRNFKGKKFVYLSTDYVFDGTMGNYSEDDVPNPVNYYALTKLLGELAVRQYPNTLIIRTSFKADGPWPYPKAFIDQWTSAEYISVQAPQIAHAATMPGLYGIIHIGGKRKSVFELARQQTPTIGEQSLADIPTQLPHDVSLDSSRWNKILKQDRANE